MSSDKVATFHAEARSIGNGEFQIFIENVSSPAHFIRFGYGYIESIGKKRTDRIINEAIISPLLINKPVFLDQVDISNVKGRRLWIVIEAVVRQPKHRKGAVIGHFGAAAPPSRDWLTTIGSVTPFKVNEIDSELYKEKLSSQPIETVAIKENRVPDKGEIAFNSIYTETNAEEFSPYEFREGFQDVIDRLAKKIPSTVTFRDEDLLAIQNNFHSLMHYRYPDMDDIRNWLNEHANQLPIISNNLLNETEAQWFTVQGMFGGYSYGLFERDGKPVLVTDSWARISSGSGRQHEITPEKVELIAKGFV